MINRCRVLVLASLMLFLTSGLHAVRQAPSSAPASTDPKKDQSRAEAKPVAPPSADAPGDDDKPIVTHHDARVEGRAIKYTVTTGFMPIRNDAGETEARMFFMAYTLDGATAAASRPLMFSFNGGPGSSSVWLHLGALGPKRVRMENEGWMPAPPYQLVDNEHSWLDTTDLVFIDPVGTGYSRATTPEVGKKFWGLNGDIRSVGEFIRMYLTRYDRWSSPLFLVGESYGTTRAAGLAGHLIDRGIAFNGIVLISSILNFQTADFAKGNDLPYVLLIPTYAATAWYHKKLGPEFTDLKQVLAEAERWASNEYTLALGKGDQLSADERRTAIDQMARITGLSKTFIDNCDLRVALSQFNAELLRDRKRTVGRLDSRFTGLNAAAASESPDFDPAMAAIRPPYTAMFSDYVRTSLGYKSDAVYYILGGGFRDWDFGSDNKYADTSEALRSAFAKNPSMKLFIASGYYDQATPYFATKYTVAHMGLDPSLRKNVSTSEYEAGHMMYIHMPSLEKLKRDVTQFITSAIGAR
jgi:carboxypeptidase C (cathepsin A)